MIEQGKVKDMKEAFFKYLAQGGLAYVQKEGLTPHMAVQLLKENSAFSSLAHPKFISKDENEILQLIQELKNIGLNAIEANYAGLDRKSTRLNSSHANISYAV